MSIATDALAVLQDAGVRLKPGLTADELAGIEERHGFRFAPEHRELLALALPAGRGWMEWREDDEEIEYQLDLPFDGVRYDVRTNGFWPSSWGVRPASDEDAEAVAQERLGRWHRLVPLFGHRYVPADPCPEGAPVLSVMQTDVIYYGADLADWARRELFLAPGRAAAGDGSLFGWSHLLGESDQA